LERGNKVSNFQESSGRVGGCQKKRTTPGGQGGTLGGGRILLGSTRKGRKANKKQSLQVKTQTQDPNWGLTFSTSKPKTKKRGGKYPSNLGLIDLQGSSTNQQLGKPRTRGKKREKS